MKIKVKVSALDKVTVTAKPFTMNVPVKEPGKAKVVVPKAPLMFERRVLPTVKLMTPSLFTSTIRRVLVAVCPAIVVVTVRWSIVTA